MTDDGSTPIASVELSKDELQTLGLVLVQYTAEHGEGITFANAVMIANALEGLDQEVFNAVLGGLILKFAKAEDAYASDNPVPGMTGITRQDLLEARARYSARTDQVVADLRAQGRGLWRDEQDGE